jgi:hypothetical protein
MSMNAISAKMERNRARARRKLREQYDDEYTDELNLNVEADGISGKEFRNLRKKKHESVDLDALKKKYQGMDLGRRIAPRFPINMSVVVFSQNTSFRTESLNISATGVLLKDLLPASFMEAPIEVLFIYENPRTGHKQHMLFGAMAVGGPLRSARVTFKSSVHQSAELLEGLFVGLTPIPFKP